MNDVAYLQKLHQLTEIVPQIGNLLHTERLRQSTSPDLVAARLQPSPLLQLNCDEFLVEFDLLQVGAEGCQLELEVRDCILELHVFHHKWAHRLSKFFNPSEELFRVIE